MPGGSGDWHAATGAIASDGFVSSTLNVGPVDIGMDKTRFRGRVSNTAGSVASPGSSPISPLPRVTPVFGKIWPVTLPQVGAVQINYTAGYGASASAVPDGIRHWMLMRVATLYVNREEVAILGRGKVDPLPYVDGLLDPYRVPVV